MLDPSAPKPSAAERFPGEGVLSGTRPGPRGVSSLCAKARDYLSAAGRTYPQGHLSAPPPGPVPRPRHTGSRRAGCRPSPSPGGRRPLSRPAPLLPASSPRSPVGLCPPAGLRAPCPPRISVPSSPGGWAPGVLHASPTMPSSVPCNGGTQAGAK